MCGKLSGSLANIYLGFIEKHIILHPGILLFKRYMDDICILWRNNYDKLINYIDQLQQLYDLKLVASWNYHCITFLDIAISNNTTKQQITTSPHSKRYPIYPLSSSYITPNYSLEKSIIRGQLLRTWRISNNSRQFSQTVKQFIPFIENKKYLQKAIRQYLKPVEISTNKWSSEILLCNLCMDLSRKKSIFIRKIFMIDDVIISSKEPLNCQVENIQIIQIKKDQYNLLSVLSIHYFLQNDAVRNITIIPIGHCTEGGVQQFLHKHSKIQQITNQIMIPQQERNSPCYIHWITNKPKNVYGQLYYKRRKAKLLTNFFNNYKKDLIL